jgi:hypothetical protein
MQRTPLLLVQVSIKGLPVTIVGKNVHLFLSVRRAILRATTLKGHNEPHLCGFIDSVEHFVDMQRTAVDDEGQVEAAANDAGLH